ncbi:ribonuclease H-like domain-containing protein [Pisolithus orientalis]|uniref:ribonuclease H-like domain-containing protein n=1 Tax=Pisolithus orientalis TaxID=936130 RepID=UPI002225981B|nr:ribonuclease H-like domain-containing protein [Pisolithus orientalis]KAI6007548.1 ribonuclease H-like domain-containing protein [Pisolithus orientalis]
MAKASSKVAYYAVTKGRQPSIYPTWFVLRSRGSPHEQKQRLSVAGKLDIPSELPGKAQSISTGHQPITSTVQTIFASDADAKEFNVVYCDGACKGNGQDGSIAGIGVWWGRNDPRNLSERCPGAQTNNRAELIAIVRILETTPALKRKLLIKTDSQYSIQCVTSWIFKWMTNGFRTTGGQPVKNCALIKYLSALLHARKVSGQTVEFKHVRGHVGLEGNEAADGLANAGSLQSTLPERDWEQLEQDVLKNMSQKKKAQEREKIVCGGDDSKQRSIALTYAYVVGLLDDDELTSSTVQKLTTQNHPCDCL